MPGRRPGVEEGERWSTVTRVWPAAAASATDDGPDARPHRRRVRSTTRGVPVCTPIRTRTVRTRSGSRGSGQRPVRCVGCAADGVVGARERGEQPSGSAAKVRPRCGRERPRAGGRAGSCTTSAYSLTEPALQRRRARRETVAKQRQLAGRDRVRPTRCEVGGVVEDGVLQRGERRSGLQGRAPRGAGRRPRRRGPTHRRRGPAGRDLSSPPPSVGRGRGSRAAPARAGRSSRSRSPVSRSASARCSRAVARSSPGRAASTDGEGVVGQVGHRPRPATAAVPRVEGGDGLGGRPAGGPLAHRHRDQPLEDAGRRPGRAPPRAGNPPPEGEAPPPGRAGPAGARRRPAARCGRWPVGPRPRGRRPGGRPRPCGRRRGRAGPAAPAPATPRWLRRRRPCTGPSSSNGGRAGERCWSPPSHPRVEPYARRARAGDRRSSAGRPGSRSPTVVDCRARPRRPSIGVTRPARQMTAPMNPRASSECPIRLA